ncbi:hypothetical protein [Streptomyces sp. NRRL B-1347]|uniref:hypothetical protein n=1 Tax=Streptomyces sp. NRRL B-1347 TaxID=1476877 RepID=UPI0004CBB34C|nr:hypothetical protein [Streptomyces sp. NRRL B-1347]
MIFVAEGPSAAGKSRYVSSLRTPGVVEELPGYLQPDSTASLEEVSRFWVCRNEERWAEAVQSETMQGIAVCDTDPLKLHYAWTLARAGLVSAADTYSCQLRWVRDSLRRRALGIADLVACVVPSESTLRARRADDVARQRRNFEKHVRLALPLREWYGALNDVDPGRVVWEWPEELPPSEARARYDLDLFDAWMGRLPTL